MVEGNCWECKFYNKTRRDQGECRRMPPPWKLVDNIDWCGEYVPNNNPVEEQEKEVVDA